MASSRNATEAYSPLSAHPPPSLEIFDTWLESNGITRNPYIAVGWDDRTGWGVKAHQDITKGAILCAIPKSTILSHRTASFSQIHPLPDEPSSTDAILHLTACLLYELHLGERSRWYGYLQLLPRQPILIPTSWGVKEFAGEDGELALEWLKGTEAEKELRRKEEEGLDLTQLRDHFDTISPLFSSTNPSTDPLLCFLYAYSLVSTRAFIIDAYHTIGIIPFCDMFNHSSTSSHTSLLCDRHVCPTCGSTLACEHESGDERQDWLVAVSPSYLKVLEQEGGTNVDMRAERDVRKGEEVFSCYDDGLGDGKLLVEWGFVEGGVGGDGLIWNARDVVDGGDVAAFVEIVRRGNVNDSLDALMSETAGNGESARGSPKDEVSSSQMNEEINTEGRIIALTDPSRPFGLLNLSLRGEVSVNLIIAMCLRAGILNQFTSEEEAEATIIEVVRTIIERDQGQEGQSAGMKSDSDTAVKMVVEAVIDLLESRTRRYHCPDRTLDEMREVQTVRLDCTRKKGADENPFSFIRLYTPTAIVLVPILLPPSRSTSSVELFS